MLPVLGIPSYVLASSPDNRNNSIGYWLLGLRVRCGRRFARSLSSFCMTHVRGGSGAGATGAAPRLAGVKVKQQLQHYDEATRVNIPGNHDNILAQ